MIMDGHTKFPGVSFFIPTKFNSNNTKSTRNSSSSKQATAAANAAGSNDIDWRGGEFYQR